MIASSDCIHARPLRRRLDAQHVGVRRQRARPAAQHGAAARHVVELHPALRHQERMVIRQAGHAGAQPDVLGALGRGGDDHFRRGDHFPAGGMVLADPGLVVAELVEPLDQSPYRGRSPASGSRRRGGTGRERCRTVMPRWAMLTPVTIASMLSEAAQDAKGDVVAKCQVWVASCRALLGPTSPSVIVTPGEPSWARQSMTRSQPIAAPEIRGERSGRSAR